MKQWKRYCSFAAVGILFCFIPNSIGEPIEKDKTLSPYFYIESENGTTEHFPLKNTNVDVTISGVIADVTVKQEYANEGTAPISARYIFPASTRAAVHGMRMQIGENIITAKVKEREAAKQEFEEAKKEGKSASLLQQERPNVFSMNVANIMPGDQIIIELHYTELLVPTNGIYEFIYPTVVGPRYSNQTESSAPNDTWVKNPYLKNGEEPRTKCTITTNVSCPLRIQDLACLSHKTHTDWHSKHSATIELADNNDFAGNRDYIIHYRLTDKKIVSGLMLYEGDDENFFLMMAQPPEKVSPEHIPPREYIFIVDISGSMHGFPLNTSKKLLKDLIGNLRPEEKFNVLLFAGGSYTLSPQSLPATSENINKAIRLIDNQRGGGGTELYPAMKRALKLPRDNHCSRSIVVVTDGYISSENKVFELIHNNLDKTNVFAFGIGSSVNRYLIEGIAKAGQGEPFVVTDSDRAGLEAAKFRRYIASPVLTDISITYDDFEVYDVEPSKVPDMLAQRPIIVFGKWRGKPKGTITITGTSGNGTYAHTANVAQNTPKPINAPLRYLWARKRISRLSDFNFNRTSEHQAEVTTLGLTYNLLTDYTSFIAVHEVIRNETGENHDVNQSLPLPLEVSNLAVGGAMQNAPEPNLVLMIVAALGIACTAYLRKRRKSPILSAIKKE